MNRAEAELLLQRAVGTPMARFRPGQWEAIDLLVNRRSKLIVVERTGWGKSSVYFISTRILRDRGFGPTLIVSPLLALMRNQIESANRLQIRASTINSTNRKEWDAIREQVVRDETDALLVAPERLANESFVDSVLMPIAERIGLFVVDEAHCISDWGHDFRPDYRRLSNILRQMPRNMPVLGTTATANNRVIKDATAQLGGVRVHRGSLARTSIALQTLRIPSQAARLAWLAESIPEFPGTGIVYVLTTRDADQVAAWLMSRGIDARAYYSNVKHDRFPDSNAYRQHLEDLLLNNEIKALVATTALGMGYDKPDIGFVIHYQAPSSVIAYYQQIGRAGRGIDTAIGVLLAGKEDSEIVEHFRRSAFPPESDVDTILETLEPSDGMTSVELQRALNLRPAQVDRVLKIISVETPAPVIKTGSKWLRTPVPFQMNRERIQRLAGQREVEWRELQDYIDTDDCLMAYLRRALDDPEAGDCGRCANCIGQPIVHSATNFSLTIEATRVLKTSEFPFNPKKQLDSKAFPIYGFGGSLPSDLRASEGRILSRWGDAGWGAIAASNKRDGSFGDELIEALADMIRQRWRPTPEPEWITCVPSLNNPHLVPSLTLGLAQRLDLPFHAAVVKLKNNEPQKAQQNRFHQCLNLDGAFGLSGSIPETPVLLVDDVIDSGWTVTVVAALLRQSGSGVVHPVALASTSPRS